MRCRAGTTAWARLRPDRGGRSALLTLVQNPAQRVPCWLASFCRSLLLGRRFALVPLSLRLRPFTFRF